MLKIISGYRENRDALAKFGGSVRQQALTNHWQYEAVSASDEGLLLYLQKTRFIDGHRAISEWNERKIDALVVPADEAPLYLRDLLSAEPSAVPLWRWPKERKSTYVLLVRAAR
jgi:hypothetical protein